MCAAGWPGRAYVARALTIIHLRPAARPLALRSFRVCAPPALSPSPRHVPTSLLLRGFRICLPFSTPPGADTVT